MKTKIDCDVILDLLPLYHDEVVSESTKTLIEEHLSECEKCRHEYDLICKDLPSTDDVSVGRQFVNTMKTKRIKNIIIKILIVFLVFFVWFFSHPLSSKQALNKDLPLDYTEIVYSEKVDNYEVFFLKNDNDYFSCIVEKNGLFYKRNETVLSHISLAETPDLRGYYTITFEYEHSGIYCVKVVVWDDIEYIKYNDEYLNRTEYEDYTLFYGWYYDDLESFTYYDKDNNEIDLRY